MLIIPSKELLLITAQESKQIFLFDPKTTAVLTKYHSEASMSKALAYYPHANQFLTSFNNKTFVTVWSTDCQEPLNKVSTVDMVTFMTLSKDKNILFGGSQNGNVYFWELPTGILIRKANVHSGQIKKINEYKSGYLMTASAKQVKIWNLSSFYIENQRSTPIKIISSVLDILDVEYARNIFMILTSKSITYYLGGNEHNPFAQLSKQDIEFPTTLCTSLSHLYVGNCQGEIYVRDVMVNENSFEFDFKYSEPGQSLEVNKVSKKSILKGDSNHPISCLIHMKTIPYLISGNTEGDVSIWHNHTLKRSIKLFKTSIKFIFSIPKPSEDKILQNIKIRPLAKFQQNKQTQPMQVDIQKLRNEEQLNESNQFDLHKEVEIIEEDVANELILERMLQVLNRPQQILRGRISQLEKEKEHLIQANIHFAEILTEEKQKKQQTTFDF